MTGEALLPVEVYVGQDFYVPAYRVFVGDEELGVDELYDVISVTYTDSLTAIDAFDMTINNFDPDEHTRKPGTYKYSDGKRFNPFKSVELFMGYFHRGQDQRRRMLTGEITTLSPSFPASGAPTLNVRGLNLLHRFRLKQETISFFDKTDTEVAQALTAKIDEALRQQFPKMRVTLDPDDVDRNEDEEEPHDFLVVNNQFPIVFMMERARRIGYELTIKEMPRGNRGEVVLGFGPTNAVQRPTYILEWGKTLISFQPTLRVAQQVSKVTVRDWDPGAKKPIDITVTRNELKGEGVLSPRDLDIAEPSLAQEITVDRPVANKQEAKNFAKSILRQTASELVVAKGKTIGLPDLRAGVKVRIKGLGKRFSGTDEKPFFYVITDTTHTISDGGYTTDFGARLEGGPELS